MEYNRSRRYLNRNMNCAMPMENRPNPVNNCNNWEVAMAYVPWQTYTETYDLCRALQVGTIFPELNKPFMAAGRCARI
jgi:hypothetical protein